MTLQELTKSQVLRGRLLQNEALAEYTSWRVGGPADYVYIPQDIQDVATFLKSLPQTVPVLWLGLGSNVLIRDGGIDGAVIITQGALNHIESINSHLIRAEAGVACAQLARHTARLGLTGLEFLAGIPGTVGGALAMNAGCYGGETWNLVQSVEMINREGEIISRPATDFTVGYRHVKKSPSEWFVAACFQLKTGNKDVSLAEIKNLLEKRTNAQPTGLPNCGSVFRNPPGNFAGNLIEQQGLKGTMIGGARVSEKHANFIINENNATAADIEQLILHVQKTVEREQGIKMIPEVCVIGKS